MAGAKEIRAPGQRCGVGGDLSARPAPGLDTPQNELHNYRKSLVALTRIAGLADLPQVRVLWYQTYMQDIGWIIRL